MKSGTTDDDPFSDREESTDEDDTIEPDARDLSGAESPITEPAEEAAPVALVDAIEAALDAIEAGDRHSHLSVRDQPIAALLAALEDRPGDRRELGDALYTARDRDPQDDYDRSELLRAALRLGIEAAAPEVLEQLGEARARRVRDV